MKKLAVAAMTVTAVAMTVAADPEWKPLVFNEPTPVQTEPGASAVAYDTQTYSSEITPLWVDLVLQGFYMIFK